MGLIQNFSNFMVFELKDTGERERLFITEQEFSQENGEKILHDSQVALIVKEELRKIYIWKGYQSTVRKKFIASRVAQQLQQELMNSANFHRCKIRSIDQGEEPLEFLNDFGLKSQKIPENVEVTQPQFVGLNPQKKYRNLSSISAQDTEFQIKKRNCISNPTYIKNKPLKSLKQTYTNPKKELLTKILQIEPQNGYKRKYILLGNNNLYGIVTKKSELFGKSIEEIGWDLYENLPKEIIELTGHKLRIHFDTKSNNVEAIEILEKKQPLETDYNRWTVKELKIYCSKNNIKIPSSHRKAQIIKLVKEFNN